MKGRFLNFIEKHALLPEGSRALLAVSGGLDSMVLCHLFRETGIPFGIAHCNFGLRGEESDADEALVSELASRWNVPFYRQFFHTQEFASARKISVQMAARELRYQWFDTLVRQESFDILATGHHLDDQVETFFINLMRGSGIGGLRGIPLQQGKVIRPMLFLSRQEIKAYAEKWKISYREDSSNASLDYDRNKIRHHLIPLLHQLQPGINSIMARTFDNLKEAEEIMLAAVNREHESLVKKTGDNVSIELSALKSLHAAKTYLHYFLKEFGFTQTAVDNLAECLENKETRVFFSEKYRLTKDRKQILVEPNQSPPESKGARQTQIPVPPGFENSELLSPVSFFIEDPCRLMFTLFNRDEDYRIIHDESIAQIDPDKLTWPLTIRPWARADQFRPLGMRGSKKISDYFIDEKFSPAEKKSALLLCSGEKIVWIIGKRLDEHFKIKPSTKRILRIDLVQA